MCPYPARDPSPSSASTAPHVPSCRRRKCRPGYKSAAKIARTREKAKYHNLAKDLKLENANLFVENMELKETLANIDNHVKFQFESLKSQYSQEREDALRTQKDYLSERHTNILSAYSEKLKQHYDKSFNESVSRCENETRVLKMKVASLSRELDAARQAIRGAGTRRPVYSPGLYSENG